MEIRYITDTDFITKKLEGDDYNLIYGIIQHCTHNSELKDKYIYNLTVLLFFKQETFLLRVVKAKCWIELLNTIIEKLSSFDKTNTLISIPFCNIYGYGLQEIIDSFRLSLFTLKEILVSKTEDIEVIDYINRCYPIQSLEDLFLNLVIEIEIGTFENLQSSDSYIIYDEMYRRGLKTKGFEIKPSEHYNENLYYRYFINATQPRIALPIEEDVNEDNEIVRYRGYDIKRIGVLYYMLHDVLKDNQELLIKVANYVIDKDYIVKNRANNAAYKYIHNPSFLIDKNWKVEYICEQLKRYNIEIPRELIKEKKDLERL